MKNTIKKESGFTLVELAIVLVIIGLLVGGVLQGQELIKQAQVRSVITSIGQFDTAVNTFRAKYNNALPGDFNKASTFGLNGTTVNCTTTADSVVPSTTAGCNGNNNGILEDITGGPGANSTTDFSGEIANFWVQLSNAGLIKQTLTNAASAAAVIETNYPKMPIGQGLIALSDGRKLNYVLGTGASIASLQTAAGNTSVIGNALKPEEAYAIDSKIDNGAALTGIVTPIDSYSTVGVFTIEAGGATGSCIDTDLTPDEYELTAQGKTCTLRIRASS